MTHTANKVASSWYRRKNGDPFRKHVNKIDPLVEVTTFPNHGVAVYAFFDRSTIVTRGRTVDFRIEVYDPPPVESSFPGFNPDDSTKES